jgi:hypothetical protein
VILTVCQRKARYLKGYASLYELTTRHAPRYCRLQSPPLKTPHQQQSHLMVEIARNAERAEILANIQSRSDEVSRSYYFFFNRNHFFVSEGTSRVVTDAGQDGRGTVGGVQTRTRLLCLLTCPGRILEPHNFLFNRYRGSFPGVQAVGT